MKIAAIQMCSSTNVSANLKTANRWIEKAVKAGAGLICLPEDFACLAEDEAQRSQIREHYGQGVIQAACSEWAKKNNIWLIAGSIPLFVEDESRQAENKLQSASLLFDNFGQVQARYDKIHLFDVEVADQKKRYHESALTLAGTQVVSAHTPAGRLGLSICYDIRFPELYRLLGEVDIISLPAAFTQVTGAVHWEILLRARAIENLCYVIAADQCGEHENGRETYGHSMIVDPWGEILDELPHGEGYVIADVDLEHIADIRQRFPALANKQLLIP